MYVEGTNGNLWWETPGWQTSGAAHLHRRQRQGLRPLFLFVRICVRVGEQRHLWVESWGWQTSSSGRTLFASNVAAFATDPYENAEPLRLVLPQRHSGVVPAPGLWGTQSVGIWGDPYDKATAFASDPYSPGDVYVLDSLGELWLEDPSATGNTATLIDSNVQAFAPGGQVNPTTNPSQPYAPAPAGAQLFNNSQPSYLDVQQGQVGDCWFLAGLAEVAARDPQAIKNMFTYDGTTLDNGATVGLYTVRFYNTAGVAVYVQVDTELPAGGDYYAKVQPWLGTQALWVALAEKGYAEANGLGDVTTLVDPSKGWNNEYQDAYIDLTAGSSMWSLQAITNAPVSVESINPTNLAAAWNAGDFITLDTNLTTNPPNKDIVFDHEYVVVGYNSSSSTPYEIFNPWGTTSTSPTPPAWAPGYAPGDSSTAYGLFDASAATVSANFVHQEVSAEAIPVKDVTQPAYAVSESATLGDGYAQSATIRVDRFTRRGSAIEMATASNLSLSSRNMLVLQGRDSRREGRTAFEFTEYDRFAWDCS